MPATSLAASSRPQRLYTLDLLRFIAAMAVVLFHYVGTASGGVWSVSAKELFPWLSSWSSFGSLGVQLFFVVSGFVILMSAWGRSLPQFVASRVSRLYPAYWVAVLLTGTIFLVLRTGEFSDINIRRILINSTMLQTGFGIEDIDVVYWTLWVELCFYLLIGLLLAVGMSYGRLVAFIALWPLVAALVPSGEGTLGGILQPSNAPYFAGGMALYLIYAFGHSWVRWGLVALNLAIALGLHDVSSSNSSKKTIIMFLIILIFATVALATLTKAKGWAGKTGTYLGRLTYPLYLVHNPIGAIIIVHFYPVLPAPITLFTAVALTLATSWLINIFVERPLSPRIRRTVESGLKLPAPLSKKSDPLTDN